MNWLCYHHHFLLPNEDIFPPLCSPYLKEFSAPVPHTCCATHGQMSNQDLICQSWSSFHVQHPLCKENTGRSCSWLTRMSPRRQEDQRSLRKRSSICSQDWPVSGDQKDRPLLSNLPGNGARSCWLVRFSPIKGIQDPDWGNCRQESEKYPGRDDWRHAGRQEQQWWWEG